MPKPMLEFQSPTGPWRQPANVSADGIDEQILSADPATGAYTRLLRFGPGTDSSTSGVQIHDFWEEVLIVSGDLTDVTLAERFTAGMYACRPPGMPHGPWRSTEGALMIEFRYYVQPSERDGRGEE